MRVEQCWYCPQASSSILALHVASGSLCDVLYICSRTSLERKKRQHIVLCFGTITPLKASGIFSVQPKFLLLLSECAAGSETSGVPESVIPAPFSKPVCVIPFTRRYLSSHRVSLSLSLSLSLYLSLSRSISLSLALSLSLTLSHSSVYLFPVCLFSLSFTISNDFSFPRLE
jgi:hypothetical protein